MFGVSATFNCSAKRVAAGSTFEVPIFTGGSAGTLRWEWEVEGQREIKFVVLQRAQEASNTLRSERRRLPRGGRRSRRELRHGNDDDSSSFTSSSDSDRDESESDGEDDLVLVEERDYESSSAVEAVRGAGAILVVFDHTASWWNAAIITCSIRFERDGAAAAAAAAATAAAAKKKSDVVAALAKEKQRKKAKKKTTTTTTKAKAKRKASKREKSRKHAVVDSDISDSGNEGAEPSSDGEEEEEEEEDGTKKVKRAAAKEAAAAATAAASKKKKRQKKKKNAQDKKNAALTAGVLGIVPPPPSAHREVSDVVADAELLLKAGPDAGLSATQVQALLHRLLLQSTAAHPQLQTIAAMVHGGAATGATAAPHQTTAAVPPDIGRLQQTLATLGYVLPGHLQAQHAAAQQQQQQLAAAAVQAQVHAHAQRASNAARSQSLAEHPLALAMASEPLQAFQKVNAAEHLLGVAVQQLGSHNPARLASALAALGLPPPPSMTNDSLPGEPKPPRRESHAKVQKRSQRGKEPFVRSEPVAAKVEERGRRRVRGDRSRPSQGQSQNQSRSRSRSRSWSRTRGSSDGDDAAAAATRSVAAAAEETTTVASWRDQHQRRDAAVSTSARSGGGKGSNSGSGGGAGWHERGSHSIVSSAGRQRDGGVDGAGEEADVEEDSADDYYGSSDSADDNRTGRAYSRSAYHTPSPPRQQQQRRPRRGGKGGNDSSDDDSSSSSSGGVMDDGVDVFAAEQIPCAFVSTPPPLKPLKKARAASAALTRCLLPRTLTPTTTQHRPRRHGQVALT